MKEKEGRAGEKGYQYRKEKKKKSRDERKPSQTNERKKINKLDNNQVHIF